MNPVRTCVGCRRRGNKTELLRLVVAGSAVVLDRRQTAPGRGAYLHCNSDCWDRALRQRSLTRGLRAGQVDTTGLVEELSAEVDAETAASG